MIFLSNNSYAIFITPFNSSPIKSISLKSRPSNIGALVSITLDTSLDIILFKPNLLSLSENNLIFINSFVIFLILSILSTTKSATSLSS